MVGRRMALVVLVGLALFALLPNRVEAQSSIAGVVKDATGAVLPGVTVEASSPVLIEGVRTVTTNEAGQYQIIELRPGVYTVTFTLPGFNVVKREGVELPTNFTATINADMRVGAVEETITVSGESPVVDLRNATSQQVLSKTLLDAVPTGRSIWAVGATLTGVTLSAPDVGGTAGMQQTYMAVHGSDRRDNAIQVDGMSVNGIEGDGAIQNYFNQGMFEEMSFQTSALSAEVQSSGVRLNMIPKDGSNLFKGSVFWSHTPGEWQSDNFSQALKDTGLRAPNRVERIFDLNPGLGGPVMKDKIWFFTSFRRWGVDQTITDSFYNADPTHRTYRADLARPTVDDNVIKSGVLRLTMQMAQKHKFAAYLDRIVKYRGHECPALSAEEACGIRWPKRYYTAQAKYTGTWTSRILVEAGWSENDETYNTNGRQPSVPETEVGRTDRNTTERWSAPIGPYYFREPDRHTFTGTMSYVTGSHAVKSGFQLGKGGNRHQRTLSGGVDLYQEYRSTRAADGTLIRTPASAVVHSTPQEAAEKIKYDLGLFVQDAWTFKRMTMSPGLRVELFNTYVPGEDSPAGRFVPARHFDKIENLPNWKDTAPRFGVVYDLLGDGKTALKGHIGKYMRAFSTVGFAAVYNPMVIQTDRRTWLDCDLNAARTACSGVALPTNGDDIAQDNEIGPVQSPFNISGISNRIPDANIKRPYQWETNIGIQRELRRGVSVSANWVRRDFRRLFWTDNILVSAEDYTIVNVRNPLDPSELIPIYNLNVAKRGQVQNVDKNSDTNRRWYNGFDVGFSAKIHGGELFGGTSIGRQITAWCEVDNPNALRYCDQRDLGIPYLAQYKLAGSYPLPFGIQISGNWQGYPGVPTGTNRQDTDFDTTNNRITDPSLNVNYIVDRTIVPNLTQTSVTVPLLKPGTKYLKRWNQVDVRLARKFQIRNIRVQGQLDIFNLINASSILGQVESYGTTLGRPTAILQGRLFAVGAQLNF